jgi:uncharacterized protein YjbI with pentapeptide repeats
LNGSGAFTPVVGETGEPGTAPEIQAVLRHSSVSTTMSYYVKSTASDVTDAMQQFAENLQGQNLRDSDRTPKPDSGATPGFVN